LAMMMMMMITIIIILKYHEKCVGAVKRVNEEEIGTEINLEPKCIAF